MMFASTPRLIPEKVDSSPILASLSSCEVLERPMAKMTYAEQLKHPNWQKKRLEILDVMSYSMRYHSKSSIAASVYGGVVDTIGKGLAGA